MPYVILSGKLIWWLLISYYLFSLWKVKIYEKGGQLWFSSRRSPKLTGPMYHYKANAFAIRWEQRDLDADAFAIFTLDEQGVAQSMIMKGISPDIDFSYDFQDLDFRRVEE